MSKWITTKLEYGKRHIHKDCKSGATIEQYNDGREYPCEVWGSHEIKNKRGKPFLNLRSARADFIKTYVNGG